MCTLPALSIHKHPTFAWNVAYLTKKPLSNSVLNRITASCFKLAASRNLLFVKFNLFIKPRRIRWVSDFPSKPRELLTHRYSTRCYRGADKSLARPTSRCILYDGENISFDASLVIYIYIYIYSTNISPIMAINRTYENQNLLSL